MIPDFEEEEGFLNWLRDNYAGLFRKELEAWRTDQSTWPELTTDNFAQWFELSFLDAVEDLVEEEPLVDELPTPNT